jgi:lipopolysaccharide transport system permease protein
LLPLLLVFEIILALSIGLFLGPINVRFRDVIHVLPFLIQVWMYASPVVYGLSIVPERWRILYSLNPMVGVIEGFRYLLIGKGTLDVTAIAMSAAFSVAALVAGLFFFSRTERSFADVI